MKRLTDDEVKTQYADWIDNYGYAPLNDADEVRSIIMNDKTYHAIVTTAFYSYGWGCFDEVMEDVAAWLYATYEAIDEALGNIFLDIEKLGVWCLMSETGHMTVMQGGNVVPLEKIESITGVNPEHYRLYGNDNRKLSYRYLDASIAYSHGIPVFDKYGTRWTESRYLERYW